MSENTNDIETTDMETTDIETTDMEPADMETIEAINKVSTVNFLDLMNKTYEYPQLNDDELQSKIYEKREFYYHKIPERPNLANYQDIKEYRDTKCSGELVLEDHQSLLSNIINPDTPYKGLIIFHGTGTGKCVRGDNLVYANGNVCNFENLWENYNSETTKVDKDGAEWNTPKNEIIVNSFNEETQKITKCKVKSLYRQKVSEKLNQITLDNGFIVTITKAHKLLKENGWENNLQIGDYVAIPKICYNNENPLLNTGEIIIDELIYLMACLLSNKCDIVGIYYYIISLPDTRYLAESITKVGIYYNINMNFKNNGINCARLCSFDYINFLTKLGHKWSQFKIPDFIMNLPKNKLKLFLKNYLNINGYICENNMATFTHSSNIVIKQMFYLFKIFGINSTINNNTINFCIENLELMDDCIKVRHIEEIDHEGYVYVNNNMETDISFVKVKHIEEINHEGYVYDLEIDTHHNYVTEGLICHNTCSAIAVAEKFKDMVRKYNTKIYVLTSGPLLKENWKKELIKCTGETYKKQYDVNAYMNDEEKTRLDKNAIAQALQYYKFMSYKGFYKRVLGEKIKEIDTKPGSKTKASYRKTDEGEFERDISVDKIYNLDNTLLIVDEAHNLTGNERAQALKKIIKASTQLKILLLSATPMKNSASDIIDLLNFLRPEDSQIERDKIFVNAESLHQMDFREGGLKYLKKMASGYVSHLRGADPLTFAKRIDRGVKLDNLLFTKIVPCKMLKFQEDTYYEAIKNVDDTLERRAGAVANFVFPALDSSNKKLVGYYGKEGIETVKNQLRSFNELINTLIQTDVIKEKIDTKSNGTADFLEITKDGKNITGKIFRREYLKYFSIKFHTAFEKVSNLVWGAKGPRTAFIYSNLVRVGTDMFKEVLLQNGYLEYQEIQNNYIINDDTTCYYCGEQYGSHDKTKAPKHKFYPATFITVTGKNAEDAIDVIPEDKQRILEKVFSNMENKEGKYIKFVLGSKVMNEGISLSNVAEVHILDVHFNLGRVDQVIGRGIRHCSHYKMMTEENQFPSVDVYKYAIVLDNEMSSEIKLYKQAESKYLLIKKIERAMKEIAIDCPLNMNGNIFKEEIKQHEKCGEHGEEPCPAVCDYQKCEYKCEDKKLNLKYYDPSKKLYKRIEKGNLDYSTFTNTLARTEIDYCKKKIKEIFLIKYVDTLDDIIKYIENSYDSDKKDLFDDFFVYKALDEMIPLTENDFNNYKDTIYDKYNVPGYLIYRNKYYIFQPFDQNENVTMYYRTQIEEPQTNKLSLYNFLKNTKEYQEYLKTQRYDHDDYDTKEDNGTRSGYDFDSVVEYYDSRPEFKYVGIIDKELSRRKSKLIDEMLDVFKVREKRDKILDKKRGTGIPSLKGAVCTSKNKPYLEQMAKDLKIKFKDDENRIDICGSIKQKLLELEKYSVGKDKMTYIMIPANHPIYPFPYNLVDRTTFVENKIKEIIGTESNLKIKSDTKEKYAVYKIVIKHDKKLDHHTDFLKSLQATLIKGEWTITIA